MFIFWCGWSFWFVLKFPLCSVCSAFSLYLRFDWVWFCQILRFAAPPSFEKRRCFWIVASINHVLPECSVRVRERGCTISFVFLVRFLSHVFHLLVCYVHLLVWLIVLICVKISTLFGFHQYLQSLTFLIRLEIALEMCSIRPCSFQFASGDFW